MPHDLTIRCACGAVSGVLRGASPEAGTRVVCHCRDCQAFQRLLGFEREVLDAQAGTDLFQTTPGRVTFATGADRLACLRLTERGPLRWHAACCDFPLANTAPTRALPFVSLVAACLRPGPDGATVDAALGPVRGHVFVASAPDPEALEGRAYPLWRFAPAFAALVLGAWARGEAKRNPFFDPATGRPVAAPRRLTPEERESAYHR